MQKKDDEYLTHAPKNKEYTVSSESFPNRKNAPGGSVDEHELQETANAILAEGEIGQQRENN